MGPLVHEVFTPLGCTEHAFVERPALVAARAALAVPGAQLLLHGPSGAGKTTAAVRALAGSGLPVVMTRCRLRGGLAEALAAVETAPGLPWPAVAEAVPPAADARTVANWLLDSGLVWLLESVHKLPPPTQSRIAEIVRYCAAAPGRGRVLALGLDPALAEERHAGARPVPLHRIAVAPMTPAELDALLLAGAASLNVVIPAWMRAGIVAHAAGHPSICHVFALHLCLAAGVAERAPAPVTVDADAYQQARRRTPTSLL